MPEARKKRVKKVDIGYGYDSIFPKNLRTLLDMPDMTQDKLASHLGVARQSVAQWKDGKTMPDIYYLEKISEYFDVSTDFLLGRTPNPTTDTNVRAICEYTGLREKSLITFAMIANNCERTDDNLKVKELYQKMLYVINAFLSHHGFVETIASNIARYFESFHQVEKECREFDMFSVNSPKEPRDSIKSVEWRTRHDEYISDISKIQDKRDRLLFNVQKDFVQMVEHLGKKYVAEQTKEAKNGEH